MDLTPGDAAVLIPGLSRSGSTLTVGVLMGVRRDAAARFTFLMGIGYLIGHRLDVFAYYRLALAAVVRWFVQ